MEGSGLGDWTGPFRRGAEGDRFKLEELLACEALLLGRVTYGAFAAVWPRVRDEVGFADRINALPKFVASNSLRRADWHNTTILAGDVIGQVRGLKAGEGGDLLVYGSAALVHALARHNLVDAYTLMVYPTVLGHGTRLFPDGMRSTLALEEPAVRFRHPPPALWAHWRFGYRGMK